MGRWWLESPRARLTSPPTGAAPNTCVTVGVSLHPLSLWLWLCVLPCSPLSGAPESCSFSRPVCANYSACSSQICILISYQWTGRLTVTERKETLSPWGHSTFSVQREEEMEEHKHNKWWSPGFNDKHDNHPGFSCLMHPIQWKCSRHIQAYNKFFLILSFRNNVLNNVWNTRNWFLTSHEKCIITTLCFCSLWNETLCTTEKSDLWVKRGTEPDMNKCDPSGSSSVIYFGIEREYKLKLLLHAQAAVTCHTWWSYMILSFCRSLLFRNKKSDRVHSFLFSQGYG